MYYGERVYLRALDVSDSDTIIEHWNSLDFHRYLGVPLPRSRRYMEIWLEKRSIADPWRDGLLELAIVDKHSSEFLGLAHLEDIRRPHSRAEFGISIHNPKNLSKGYGTDATRVMLWIGFNILGLHSIYLDTMEANFRAIRTYEKVGFRRVGLLRETEFLDGTYKGLLVMDILRDEFIAANPSFEVKGIP
ncbi:N-acetyltransferase [Candidatus Thorarchaeota archaeon]|nr:MAG: N-acetyltransferase [Candidatus Thorarchaeota archaeon]